MKKVVYSKVGNYEAKRITSFGNQQEAEAAIRNYERQDRYDMACGWVFPHGLPIYEIRDI